MPHGDRIAEYLLSIGAVRLSPNEPFTWTSGIKSPIYCDNRMIYSHPEARTFFVQALASRVKTLHVPPDVVAGTATAAIGWAALVSDRLELPFVYVRAKAKEHGAKKRIEGDLKPEKHVVVVEDLISTGGSSISTVEALREEGKAVVTDIVSIFTYEFEAATESAGENSIALHPLTTISALVKIALGQGRITPEDAKMIAAFAKDPQGWGKKQ
ncbi:MAG: orotate phosphoribosyltransferase [Candidatus Peribacteraceae bacterium]|nr:orotate phosphoribosyltransferase [Candidatus Peribacteraceae bacterium]